MHPSHRAPLMIERNVALDQAGDEAVPFEFFPAPGTGEKTSIVLELLRFDNERTL